MLIGSARCSADTQDFTVQQDGLTALGVKANRIYVDHGLTGRNRDRPRLREALAACRCGDTLVVTTLDRLARSLPDARDIVEELTAAEVKLNIGGSLHDPNDPIGRLLFDVLAMIAEFESDLIKMRTREGTKVAKAKGRLRGKPPKLSPTQETHLAGLYQAGQHTTAELPNCSPSPDRRSIALSNAPATLVPPEHGRRTLPIGADDSTVTSTPLEAGVRSRWIAAQKGRDLAVAISLRQLENGVTTPSVCVTKHRRADGLWWYDISGMRPLPQPSTSILADGKASSFLWGHLQEEGTQRTCAESSSDARG